VQKSLLSRRKIGPAGEAELVKGLRHANAAVRACACRLLKDFGSAASVAGLRDATRDTEGNIAAAAWDVWRAVALRKAEIR
jgi:hypothetical protein